MELHDLKIFHYIAAEQSFSKAAQELFISQPAASASIKKLEFDMGCKLFERNGKTIRLTPAGEILYRYTTQIFEIVHSIHADIEKQSGEVKGNITVAAGDAAGCFLLPKMISSFTAKYENVNIQLCIGAAAYALRLVEEGRADFAIVGGELENKTHNQLCAEKLTDDSVVLISSPTFYLDKNEGLEKLTAITYEKGTTLHTAALEIFDSLPMKIQTKLVVNSISAMIQAVKANAGIAAVPLSTVAEEIKTGRVKQLYPADTDVKFPYYLVYQKSRNQSLAEKSLCDFIKSMIDTLTTPAPSVF